MSVSSSLPSALSLSASSGHGTHCGAPSGHATDVPVRRLEPCIFTVRRCQPAVVFNSSAYRQILSLLSLLSFYLFFLSTTKHTQTDNGRTDGQTDSQSVISYHIISVISYQSVGWRCRLISKVGETFFAQFERRTDPASKSDRNCAPISDVAQQPIGGRLSGARRSV